MNRKTAIPLVILIVALVAGAGWFIWQKKPQDKPSGRSTAAARQLYTCTMHPFIIREKPGSCPICGMELIKKIETSGAEASGQQQAALPGGVSITSAQRVMANVATTEVRKEPLERAVDAVGVVQYDQTRQSRVTAWIACRIDKLNVGAVGSFVSRDKPLAEVYSPDLIATQQEYLLAVRSREKLKNSGIASVSESGDALATSAKERLRLFGVKDAQIAGLERSGRPLTRIPIYPEFSGVVIEKMVQQGQYVNAGEVLFNIADLSNVWVEIEVYENEFRNIRVGQQVEIRSQSWPGTAFMGKVALIYPYLDPKTRTVRVRVQLPNPGTKLKPDMFVNAVIRQPLGDGIAVPVTAVMDTGKRQLVWVEKAPGSFEPREVALGARIKERVQILSGLAPGDKVVTSGGYLIDSESQLNGGNGSAASGK